MIAAQTNLAALGARLAARARVLALAHVQARPLAGQADERRWRRAGLLWPLFTGG